jgi:hypothetical protein
MRVLGEAIRLARPSTVSETVLLNVVQASGEIKPQDFKVALNKLKIGGAFCEVAPGFWKYCGKFS